MSVHLFKPFTSQHKERLFAYCEKFKQVAWLDSNQIKEKYGSKGAIIALGAKQALKISSTVNFSNLATKFEKGKWWFGFIAYDFKNCIYTNLKSQNPAGIDFPDLYFFEPQILLKENNETLEIEGEEHLVRELTVFLSQELKLTNHQLPKLTIQARMSQEQFEEAVKILKQRIHRGEVYELNFCHEFFVEGLKVNPYSLHRALLALSPTPFSSFFRNDNQYILCASPERFLKKMGGKLISQPIKGTIKRGANLIEDEIYKTQLLNDPKERSENVMIVDLVRNDLSQIAKDGSVKVEELFGIYSFSQVHQMISTISCSVPENIHFWDVIKATFPMGSMTGAPKLRAMELIESTEKSKRGIYSGSIGYVSPDGDFDFNVVIRSLLYDANKGYLSFSVGGAITANSIPEKEYQETLLKAAAILQVLRGK